jgi:hypothetical protein
MGVIVRTTVAAALVLVFGAATGAPSPAAADPCSAEVAAKNAALATYQADLHAATAIRRQIPPVVQEIYYYDAIEWHLTIEARAYQARADALQPRIDASPAGSALRAVLERRQASRRAIAGELLDEASDAGVRADIDESYARDLRDQVERAQETADDDHVLLDEAQTALAACRAAHLAD